MASFSHSVVLHYFLMVHKDVFVNKNLNKKMTTVNIKIPNSCSGYFSYCYDKGPWQKQFNGGVFYFAS